MNYHEVKMENKNIRFEIKAELWVQTFLLFAAERNIDIAVEKADEAVKAFSERF